MLEKEKIREGTRVAWTCEIDDHRSIKQTGTSLTQPGDDTWNAGAVLVALDSSDRMERPVVMCMESWLEVIGQPSSSEESQ